MKGSWPNRLLRAVVSQNRKQNLMRRHRTRQQWVGTLVTGGLLALLFPLATHGQTEPQPTAGSEAASGQIHFQIGDYSFQMPVQGMQQQSLQKQTLATEYENGSSLSVSIVPRADFEERSTISAAQYLKDLFGEQQPTSTILQVIRDRNLRDVSDKQIETRGHLTFYVLTYSDHQAIYVADDYQPEYFVSVESRNQPLQPILESFQGGKAGATSISPGISGAAAPGAATP